MKFSLKIVSSAIGLALLAGASVALAGVGVPGTMDEGSVTAVKNPLLGVLRSGSNTIDLSTKSPVVVVALDVKLVSVNVSTSSCPIVTTFMKVGVANNSGEVTKLQSFLKNQEKLDVDVTGIYDKKTEAAVMAFQRANMADIMGPWGATRPSGAVYLTTAKKVNELACGVKASINKDELATINSYKSAADAAASQAMAEASVTVSPTVGMENVSGPTVQGDTNSAAAGQVSVMSRFWHFLGSFFQK